MLPIIAGGLSKVIGKRNAISNKEISEKILKKYEVKLSDSGIRKIITHIRLNNLVPGLVANGDGYYVTTSIEELKRWDKSLEGREHALQALRKGVREYIKKLESKQQYSFQLK